ISGSACYPERRGGHHGTPNVRLERIWSHALTTEEEGRGALVAMVARKGCKRQTSASHRRLDLAARPPRPSLLPPSATRKATVAVRARRRSGPTVPRPRG